MDIVMPKMGESVNEGTIIKWHKKVGDAVMVDEIIFEISTDKVDTEIPSSTSGILSQILVNEGETVDAGTIVARIQSSNVEMDNSAQTTETKSEIVEEKTQTVKTKEEQVVSVSNQTSSNNSIIEIAMPKMGESVMEGTIIKWHKKVGDVIKKDEVIFEISTDKVDTEIPSPEDGTLVDILIGEQETVAVGTIVARLGSGEQIQYLKNEHPQVQEQSDVSMHDNFSKNLTDNNVTPKAAGTGFLSPLVLSIAQKENVSFDELNSIKGTGLEGRITKKDVLAYIEKRKTNRIQVQDRVQKKSDESRSISATITQQFYNAADVEQIPMDNIRQKIMDHMVHSRDTSVHVTGMIEVDMTRIHNFINFNKDDILKNQNVKITFMSFIADAAVKALKKYPLVNSSIDGNTILQKKFINLGIAVAVEPTGLIVPNIKSAGDKNIIGLAKSVADLANRARTKKLTPDDISNGTFTITNYGVFGTIFGTPIINQPEVAILGVGAIQKKPVVIEIDGSDTIAIRNIMSLTLSHDHRLIDGMLGALFLKSIKETLENFETIN